MTDELTRPLGADLSTGKHRKFWPIFTVMVVAIVAVMAAYLLLGHYDMASDVVAGNESGDKPGEQAVDESANELRPQAEEEQSAALADKSPKRGPPARLESSEPTGRIAINLPPVEFQRRDGALAHLPDPELSERISSGVLPRRSQDNLRPMDAYSRQAATEGNFGVARVVLIVGGLGISQTGTQQAIRMLPPSVTLAIAPYGNSLERWMQEARKKGHELLLQVPMEPFDEAQDPGKHTLRTNVEPVENIANLHWLMSRITNYVGIVNYLGGKFISDPAAMKPVFDEIADRGLLFVDEGSVRSSVSGAAAGSSLLPYAKVDLHVDLIRDRRKIKESLDRLGEQAKRVGVAIGYANAFPDSIAMIAEFAGRAGEEGIEITPVTAVVRDPERE